MRTMKLGITEMDVPVVGVGCMRLAELDLASAEQFVQTALEQGVNFFDHADIYGGGACEEIFAKAVHMKPSVRESIILQSKCGIRSNPPRFDFSMEYILSAVDGILRRLQTDYLDVLLLHRPDALVEPEEVAEAFERLYTSGKVRYFGVSNENPGQMQLLQKWLRQPIVANQLQFGAAHATMISSGINVNMINDAGINRDGGVLDFCRLHDITIQPWSPFQHGYFEGVFLTNEKFSELNQTLLAIGDRYEVSPATAAIAWILRHPAHMQPIVGTTKTERLKEICQAADLWLTREEWYEIYRAAGNELP